MFVLYFRDPMLLIGQKTCLPKIHFKCFPFVYLPSLLQFMHTYEITILQLFFLYVNFNKNSDLLLLLQFAFYCHSSNAYFHNMSRTKIPVNCSISHMQLALFLHFPLIFHNFFSFDNKNTVYCYKFIENVIIQYEFKIVSRHE